MKIELPGFEFYTGERQHNDVVASITPAGGIGFNAGACRKLDLLAYHWAQLGYNRKERQIAIVPTDEKSHGARTISPRKGDRGADISAKGFLDMYDIPYDKRRSYTPEVRSSGRMVIIIDLKEPRSAGRPRPAAG